MDLFGVLSLIGGLALFLFGMDLMGTGLEKSTGYKLKSLLERLTSKKLNGLLLGLGVTAIIQSSSATTVMVVGFVNSGIMTLKQAISVIMGANIGTTVTAWVLSLSGIESKNFFVQLLKPTSFTPVLALVGIVFFMFLKSEKKKDIGMIFLGFSVLIYGMDIMSSSVAPLADVAAFQNILTTFSNPILGVLAGAILAGIIQSSSASVGILQALSFTGRITIGTSIPIIMGQNIGTCITALLSSIGTNKNARRAAMVHFYFNVIGTGVFLLIFMVAKSMLTFSFIDHAANHFSIAVVHTAFNIVCTLALIPFTKWFEKLAYMTIKDDDKEEKSLLLDARLFSTPSIAINRGRTVAIEMADLASNAMEKAMSILFNYNEKEANQVRKLEDQTDVYEDTLGTYLVKLSSQNISAKDSTESAKILYLIGEFERIADYAINIVRSAEEIHDKNLKLSETAKQELVVMMQAVEETVDLSIRSFKENNMQLAAMVEPLEQVVDNLKSDLKKSHINRLQSDRCTIELGFVFSDLITALERTSDHCSNIAGCVIEMAHDSLDMHEYLSNIRNPLNEEFIKKYNEYSKKYSIKTV